VIIQDVVSQSITALSPILTAMQPAVLVVIVLRLRRMERTNRAVLELVLSQSPALTPELRRFVQKALGNLPVAE
jgi:hypothetical protein